MIEVLKEAVYDFTGIAFSDTVIIIVGVITVFGLIHYMAFREEWDEVFDMLHMFCIWVGFTGIFLLREWWVWPPEFEFQTTEDLVIGSLAVIGVGIFIIIGIVTLYGCWSNCHNIVEAILFPFIILGLTAFFFLILALALLGLVALMRDDD